MFQKLSVKTSLRRLQYFRSYSTAQQKDTFRAHFPGIIKDVKGYLSGAHPGITPDTLDRLVEILEYNVPHGKLNRGETVMFTYNYLTPERCRTPENEKLSCDLGWCVEMLQACYLMSDDIMDNSKLRRGQPSWHTLPGTGTNAVIDTMFVNHIIFDILKQRLDKPSYQYCYRNIVDTFLDCQKKTTVGQIFEYVTQNKGCQLFTMESNTNVAMYKTAYYTYVLPVFVGMYLCGIKDPDLFQESKKVLLQIGHFYQVQDDYLDCFGKSIGKSGTDIIEGKCSWPFVIALENSNSEQRKILLENYGQDKSLCEKRVKEVYREVDVPTFYEEHEETSYRTILENAKNISNQELGHLLLKLIGHIYKRDY